MPAKKMKRLVLTSEERKQILQQRKNILEQQKWIDIRDTVRRNNLASLYGNPCPRKD